MSTALAEAWTVERFLDWAASQEQRVEFDGIAPVGMVGGTLRHSQICSNLVAALRSRLRGGPCRIYGPDAGIRAGRSIRYPDASVTCTRQQDADRLVEQSLAVFEVLSPTTARTDRFTKVREYAAVSSLMRYVLIESSFQGVTALYRSDGAASWINAALALDEVVAIPEAGIELPVAELYEDIDFQLEPDDAGR